ncbi:signal transduction histidine kinase [Buttiauxella sp. BIGb0471]|uniref:sensor histidine kinase n=1 Tax=Buttiauxella sp. BIGb0471 TaxID=2940597 RepID=UPI002167B076|nr:ATP-binding protein [Buttiauxella sp. BIGb0471]MCS3602792.1 signal transduction histidine kinase [Buttiauxella sp. BIGb0471]
MRKALIWLILTVLSGGGVVVYALHQQYEEQSAEFRILYRDITVKLSQNDVILALLSNSSDPKVVQQKFPYILRWQTKPHEPPRPDINPARAGTYWINSPQGSLLIDLPTLLADFVRTQKFRHFSLSWKDTPLIKQGAEGKGDWWSWEKDIASPSQPLNLLVTNNPDWRSLPWLVLLLVGVFWAVVIYFYNQYQMTKRQRNIANLRAHFSELARLNAMGEIAAGMVHELNQPLTAILSYSQTAQRLIKQQQAEKAQPLLDASVMQTKRISALLLAFREKLHSDEQALQPINLRQVWERVTMLLGNEIERGKVSVINQVPESLPSLIASPLGIEQIFHNLLNNAIQAQQKTEKAWVTIHASQTADSIILTVTDGGQGLSEQALEQVFMPFFTTRKDGLGLGMALTETLVQRLNGSIQAQNSASGGACFTLVFPLTQQEA